MKTTTGSPNPETAVVASTSPVAYRARADSTATRPTGSRFHTNSATVPARTSRLTEASDTDRPWSWARRAGRHAPAPPAQAFASALALSRTNSSCVIAPDASSCCAAAISWAGDVPAVVRM